MMTKRWAMLISLCAMLTMFSVGLAEAANGTLTVTFKYKDPTTQVDQNLNYGYIYLRDAAKPAPMEKFFSKADYILGGAASNGKITVPVPAGKYFIRVLQRKVVGNVQTPYGPPESGDLTWFQTTPITITAGSTLDLGTKYANPFGSSITITGSIKNYSGVPLPGRFVRVSTEPCAQGGYDWAPNYCGSVIIAQGNDANGNFRIELRDPGTYYFSTFSNWDRNPGCSGYCAAPIFGTGFYPQPVTVQRGDTKTVDIVSYY